MIAIKLTSKEYFRQLTIIYFALIGGQVFFALVALYLNNNGSYMPGGQELRNIFIYLVPVFIIYGYFGGNYIFKKRIQKIKSKTRLFEKITDYRTSLIIRYALLEGSTFFSLVVYLLTGDILFLGIALLIIFIMIIQKPSREKLVLDLELSTNEKMIINDLNAVIS